MSRSKFGQEKKNMERAKDAFDYSQMPLGFICNTLGHRIMVQTQEALSDTDLPLRMIGLMWIVDLVPGLTQIEYTRIQNSDATTLGRHIDELERRKFVKRVAKADRRAHGIVLTTQGKAYLQKAQKKANDVELEIVSALGPEEHHALKRLLSQLL